MATLATYFGLGEQTLRICCRNIVNISFQFNFLCDRDFIWQQFHICGVGAPGEVYTNISLRFLSFINILIWVSLVHLLLLFIHDQMDFQVMWKLEGSCCTIGFDWLENLKYWYAHIFHFRWPLLQLILGLESRHTGNCANLKGDSCSRLAW